MQINHTGFPFSFLSSCLTFNQSFFPWKREWLPTPVFWPGEFHEQKSLAGYIPWGSQRVGHYWAANTFTFYTIYGVFSSLSASQYACLPACLPPFLSLFPPFFSLLPPSILPSFLPFFYSFSKLQNISVCACFVTLSYVIHPKMRLLIISGNTNICF